MPDLRAEQIMSQVAASLTATSAGDNVERAKIYPHQVAEAKMPAIAIYMGPDAPVDELQTSKIDWELTVLIETADRVEVDEYSGLEAGVETKLAELRKEVHAALFADYTLGLSFVHDILPGPASQPILDSDGNLPHGSQLLQFQVRYRTSRTDVST